MAPSMYCYDEELAGSIFSSSAGHVDEAMLSSLTAVQRVTKAIEVYGKESVALLTSFGVQSGIMLSVIAEACPDLRILHIHTQGATSDKDLAYGKQLIQTLNLTNFTEIKAEFSRDEFELAMEGFGISRENDAKNHTDHFRSLSQDVFKVSLLESECSRSNIKCILSGVRVGQTKVRQGFKFIHVPNAESSVRVHPILDWSDAECVEFLRKKDIPPHWQLQKILSSMERPNQGAEPTIGEEKPHAYRVSLRSQREETKSGRECGIHVMKSGRSRNSDPVPPIPNMVISKPNCRFCKAAKILLRKMQLEFVEVPLRFFPHLVPEGVSTVPIIYLNGKFIGGYGNLCSYLGVEDALNKTVESKTQDSAVMDCLGGLRLDDKSSVESIAVVV